LYHTSPLQWFDAVGWAAGRASLSDGVLAWLSVELGADLHMFQLMPLPLTVSCFSKIQIGFTFLVSAHLGSPGKRAVRRVCMYVVYVVRFPTYLFFFAFFTYLLL